MSTQHTGTRVFLWLSALTLILVAAFAVYAITHETNVVTNTTVSTVRLDDHTRGVIRPTDASSEQASTSLVFIEYSDFECPACEAAQPALRALYAEFASSTTFVYRHLPLAQHKNAKLAAYASEAAALQGKFWEMHDLLFSTQGEWSGIPDEQAKDYFVKLAEQLNIETVRFAADMGSDAVAARVKRDSDEAVRIGVRGTPSFFVNGEKLTVRSFDDLRARLISAENR